MESKYNGLILGHAFPKEFFQNHISPAASSSAEELAREAQVEQPKDEARAPHPLVAYMQERVASGTRQRSAVSRLAK